MSSDSNGLQSFSGFLLKTMKCTIYFWFFETIFKFSQVMAKRLEKSYFNDTFIRSVVGSERINIINLWHCGIIKCGKICGNTNRIGKICEHLIGNRNTWQYYVGNSVIGCTVLFDCVVASFSFVAAWLPAGMPLSVSQC